MAKTVPISQRQPLAEGNPPLYMLPSTSSLYSFDPQQGTEPQFASLSPYASDAQLNFLRDAEDYTLAPDDSFLPEPVPLEFVGSCEPLSVREAELLAQPGLLASEPIGGQAGPANSTPVTSPKQEVQLEVVDSSSLTKRSDNPSPQTEASSPPGQAEDRLENIRRTNREAQKRWRQRNKGRVRIQQQQIQTQQQELAQAKLEARQAKGELQAALQALDSLQMSQVGGPAQECHVVPELAASRQHLPIPERNLRTLGDEVRMKVDELDRLRNDPAAAPLEVFDLADNITSMLHSSGPSPVVTTVEGRPFMQSVWPQGSSRCYRQWADLAQQYSAMWSGQTFQEGFMNLSISGQSQQIRIATIVNAPMEEFLAVKDRYIKSIGTLLQAAGHMPNSPAGLRAQQLSREAVMLTFYACFLSPKRLCRASAFNYATRVESDKDDLDVWTDVMEGAAPSCEQYTGMRRLYNAFQARSDALQQARAQLSSRVGILASSNRLGHTEYSRIFAAIQALQHSVALEQKLRHEVTMLCCSNFTAFQVAKAKVIAYPRFLDPLSILESYARYEPASIRNPRGPHPGYP